MPLLQIPAICCPRAMYVSLDPISGCVDVYSPQVQQLLSAQKPTDYGKQVFLGPLCFQATVHLRRDGKHFQTTEGGFRQVRRVADRTTRQRLYKTNCHGVWRFCDVDADGAQEVIVTPVPADMVPVWQWCDQSTPSRNQTHWFCFPSEIERLLVQAWDQNDVPLTGLFTDDQASLYPHDFDVQFISGVKKTIHVHRMDMFHKMTELGKTKWVRRTFMEPDVAQKHRERVAPASPPAKNDCCPICLEDFTEGNNTVTLHCQHAFHLKCIQNVQNSNCPICRAEF